MFGATKQPTEAPMQVVDLPRQTTRGARLETPEACPFGGGGRGSAPAPVSPAKTRRKRVPRTALAAPVTAVREARNDYPMCGKAKIAVLVRRQGFDASESTVGRILKTLVEKGAVFPVPDLRRNASEPRDANAPGPEGCPGGANPPSPERSSTEQSRWRTAKPPAIPPARCSGDRGSDGGLRSGPMTGRFNFRLRSHRRLRYCSRTRWRCDRERVAEQDGSSGAGQADMGRGCLRGCRVCERGPMGIPSGRRHTGVVEGATHPGCVGVATGLHWPENAGGSQTVPCGKRIR